MKNSYKTKIDEVVEKTKRKGLIKTYSQFCKTEEGKKTELTEDEINYYTSLDF